MDRRAYKKARMALIASFLAKVRGRRLARSDGCRCGFKGIGSRSGR